MKKESSRRRGSSKLFVTFVSLKSLHFENCAVESLFAVVGVFDDVDVVIDDPDRHLSRGAACLLV